MFEVHIERKYLNGGRQEVATCYAADTDALRAILRGFNIPFTTEHAYLLGTTRHVELIGEIYDGTVEPATGG